MATTTATIMEMRLEQDGISCTIACPTSMRPSPGQYMAASSPDVRDPLPVVLFPSAIGKDWLRFPAPPLANWTTGMQLLLRGPLGHGFRMPPTTRRLALASLEGSPARLLPLADQALALNASVVVYTRSVPSGLPADVEVLPLDLLPEAPAWADFLAVDVPANLLPDLRGQLGLRPYARLACPAQVLVTTPMACTGIAGCGVCAVTTKDGWALACSDGPVFDFNVLEGG